MRIEAELKYDDRCFAKRGGMHASEGVIAISLKNIDLSLRRIADAMERGEAVETVVDIEEAAAQAVKDIGADFNGEEGGGKI